MDNEQFRKLMLANSKGGTEKKQNGTASTAPARSLSALGSKQKSSIPMTPRSVMGSGRVDFARQLAERDRATQKQKKFRTSAPKGSRLAEGYVDRAKERNEEEEDVRAARLEALEESLKNEEIDQQAFEKLRFEIAGGDMSSTHLVKGLDFKLLERIRKGENVYDEKKAAEEKPDQANEEPADEPEEDIDDAFERLEKTEIQTVTKEKAQKKGQLSTTLVPGKKRTRDQILAELRAAREAAKAKQPAIDPRFKKIGAVQAPGSRIEKDSRGREVLIIVDEDGHEKRKVRKTAEDDSAERAAFVPDRGAEVLGMEVPEFYRKRQEQEAAAEEAKEMDIFGDVGSDYDPLAGIDSESESEDEKAPAEGKEDKEDGEIEGSPAPEAMPPPTAPPGPRNYFGTSKAAASEVSERPPPFADPAVLAALRKAKTLNAAAKSEEEQQEAERQERLKKLIQSSDRDADDLDMGFGTNRLEDEEDLEEDRIKLSAWGEDDDGGGSGGKAKRKRGPKKRKGDGNNAADVLRVLEQRKAAGS